jgi:hypothetical protein
MRQVSWALRTTGRADELVAWAQATRDWLRQEPGEDPSSLHELLRWDRYNGWVYLEIGDLDGAERVAREAIAEHGYVVYGVFLVDVAIRRGEPTPPDVVQFVEREGVEAIDEYGQMGWYVIAREAAARGDEKVAFDALERAVGYWSNPLYMSDRWKQDAIWGDLREHPEYKRIYADKRRRIGPIHGLLHYFPGW